MADTELQQLAKMDRNPVQETRYQELLKTQKSTGSYSGGTNYADLARQQMQLMQEANKPAIQSFEASIPEVQTRYANEQTRLQGQVDPLKARYDNLINEVKGIGDTAVKRESIATSREAGRRGISTESGLYDQILGDRLNPITQSTQARVSELGLSREDSLRQLQDLIGGIPDKTTAAVRDIRNAIGQLMSGGNASAIQSATSLYQLQQQQAQAEAERELQERQLEAANAAKQFMTVSEGQTILDPSTGKVLFTAPKTYKPEESGGSIIDLFKQLNAGITEEKPKAPPSSFGGITFGGPGVNLANAFASGGLRY